MKRKLINTILLLMIFLTCLSLTGFANESDNNYTAINNFVINANPATICAGESLNQRVKFELKSSNFDILDIQDIVIDMEISTDIDIFPFKLEKSSYRWAQSELIEQDNSYAIDISLISRGDAKQNYYNIPFTITYKLSDNTSKTEKLLLPVIITSDASDTSDAILPRVFISASSANPKEITAGDNFALTVELFNPSYNLEVSSLTMQISCPDGIDVEEGTTTLFVNAIAPRGYAQKTIGFSCVPSIRSGSYGINFSIAYDCASQTLTRNDEVSIKVRQIPSIRISELQILQTETYLGNTLSASLSVGNFGKSEICNVNVNATDKNGIFKSYSTYVGNISAGESKNISLYFQSLNLGEGKINLVIAYEDEFGTQYEYEDEFSLYSIEDVSDQIEIPEPKDDNSVNMAPVYILLAALLLCSMIYFLYKQQQAKTARRKKFKDEFDEDDL